MSNLTQQWMAYLDGAGAMAGFPLVLAGLILMVGGWRFWQVSVAITTGVLGAIVGANFPSSWGLGYYGAIGLAVGLAALGYWKAQYALALTGGVIAAAIGMYIGNGFRLPDQVVWVMGIAFACCGTATAFIDLRQLIMVITAFEGALLVLSAAIAFSTGMPGVFRFFSTMTKDSSFFLPFLILVPTVIGTMLQMADCNRKNISAA